jgi:hypothetical protein
VPSLFSLCQFDLDGLAEFGFGIKDKRGDSAELAVQFAAEDEAAQAKGSGQHWRRASEAMIDRWTRAIDLGRKSNWGKGVEDEDEDEDEEDDEAEEKQTTEAQEVTQRV